MATTFYVSNWDFAANIEAMNDDRQTYLLLDEAEPRVGGVWLTPPLHEDGTQAKWLDKELTEVKAEALQDYEEDADEENPVPECEWRLRPGELTRTVEENGSYHKLQTWNWLLMRKGDEDGSEPEAMYVVMEVVAK